MYNRTHMLLNLFEGKKWFDLSKYPKGTPLRITKIDTGAGPFELIKTLASGTVGGH